MRKTLAALVMAPFALVAFVWAFVLAWRVIAFLAGPSWDGLLGIPEAVLFLAVPAPFLYVLYLAGGFRSNQPWGNHQPPPPVASVPVVTRGWES